jgi:acyl-CoA hydrolase
MRTVVCAEGLFEPCDAIERYLDWRSPSATDPVTLLLGVRRTPLPPGLEDRPNVQIHSLIPGRGLRTQPNVVYERKSYWQVCHALLTGALRPDALIAVAGMPSADCTRSLGVINGYLQLAADTAATIVVEEMPDLPHIAGAATVRPADLVIAAPPRAPFVNLSDQPDAVSRKIASHVAALLPREATLSLGVGKVADALVDECLGMHSIRIVSGSVGSGILKLSEAGALDKTAKVFAMSVLGGPEVTTWAASDHRVQLLPSTVIHNPDWLASHPKLVTVLGALTVDTTGNINCEQIAGRQVSGVGGAPDFAAGAAASSGGLCVVALPSRDRSGRSSLTDAVDAITVEGRYVGAIVTENGAALRGSSVRRWYAELQRIF